MTDLTGMHWQHLVKLAKAQREELAKIRVSVARIAQRAGVSLASVGLADDAPYEALHEAATTVERGWNALAGEVADAVNNTRRKK